MSRSRDADGIRPLLDDLQETLSELRAELDDEATTRPVRRRPPSPGEFLRFTEEYTIPTLVTLLETTIRSLELLGGVIRLLDPERTLSGPDSSPSRERVTRGTSAALSELRRALTEVDLPPESEARDIVADARRLSAELERHIGEFDSDRTGTGDHGAVSIDVREQRDRGGGGGAGSETTDADADAADIDVESELDSIREEVRGAGGGERTDEENEAGEERKDETEKTDHDPGEGT